MHRPELLILDEPTSGLDPLVQQTFLDLVREARAAGQTVFMSSHIMSEVEAVADRVGIIRDGRLVAARHRGSTPRPQHVTHFEITFDGPIDEPAVRRAAGGVRPHRRRPHGCASSSPAAPTRLIRVAARTPGRRAARHRTRPRRTVPHLLPGRRRDQGNHPCLTSLTKTLWDGRRALAGFAAGTALVGAMYAGFYPQVADGGDGTDRPRLLPALREALQLKTSPPPPATSAPACSASSCPWSPSSSASPPAPEPSPATRKPATSTCSWPTRSAEPMLLLHRFAALTASAALIAAVVLLAMLAIRPSARLDTISAQPVHRPVPRPGTADRRLRNDRDDHRRGHRQPTRRPRRHRKHRSPDLRRRAPPPPRSTPMPPLHLPPSTTTSAENPSATASNGPTWASCTATTAVLLTVAVTTFNRRDLAT